MSQDMSDSGELVFDELTEEQIARRLYELLEEVPVLFTRYNGVLAAGAAAGTPAAEDQTHPLGNLPWTHAGYSWAGAGDHANSYRALRLAGTQPSVGHYSLLRGVLEGAAVTQWILEPPSSSDRIARGAAAERQSYGYLSDFERNAAKNSEVPPSGDVGEQGSPSLTGMAQKRLDELAAEMAEYGVETVKVPNKTALVGTYTMVSRGRPINAAWLYGLLSGLTHHQSWAIGASSLGTPGDVAGIVGSQRVQAQADMRYTLMATHFAIGSLRRALAAFSAYVGG